MHDASFSNTFDEGETDVDDPEAYYRCYTGVVKLAKYCEREMSEEVFEDALEAAGVLEECECSVVLLPQKNLSFSTTIWM